MSGQESWRDQALCAQIDVGDIFFPEVGASSQPAKRICGMCEAKTPCLEWALHHEVYGVWGGSSVTERKLLRRQLGIRLNNDRRSA